MIEHGERDRNSVIRHTLAACLRASVNKVIASGIFLSAFGTKFQEVWIICKIDSVRRFHRNNEVLLIHSVFPNGGD